MIIITLSEDRSNGDRFRLTYDDLATANAAVEILSKGIGRHQQIDLFEDRQVTVVKSVHVETVRADKATRHEI